MTNAILVQRLETVLLTDFLEKKDKENFREELIMIVDFFLVISRAPGLKLVVQTLLSSLRPIGHIVVICCTFFIIFGILGVQVLITKTNEFVCSRVCCGEMQQNPLLYPI